MQDNKTYTRLSNFFFKQAPKDQNTLSAIDRFANDSFSKTISEDFTKPRKKIIPTSSLGGLREEFKKTFLPLLIDTFELRQMITTYKAQKEAPDSALFGHISKSPEEVLAQLQQMQNDIEEAQRWCQGVITQIAKGIDEAKEALQPSPPSDDKHSQIDPSSKTKGSIFSPLLKRIRTLCQKK